MNKNEIGLFISPEGARNRWVIPDIHGCLASFEALLEKIDCTSQDQIFLLGDYVDRGPQSRGVLLHIMAMQLGGYQIFPLRGNHEAMLLEAHSEYDSKMFARFLKFNKWSEYLEKEPLSPQLIQFLNSLPYFYNVGNALLVHAGLDFESAFPFFDTQAMLWIRDWDPSHIPEGFLPIIHGHTPRPLPEIRTAIKNNKLKIPLDNGCVFARRSPKNPKYEGLGHLCAYNLDTRQLLVQENIDF